MSTSVDAPWHCNSAALQRHGASIALDALLRTRERMERSVRSSAHERGLPQCSPFQAETASTAAIHGASIGMDASWTPHGIATRPRCNATRCP